MKGGRQVRRGLGQGSRRGRARRGRKRGGQRRSQARGRGRGRLAEETNTAEGQANHEQQLVIST